MKIRIVVDDKLVSVDRCVMPMPELDWTAFDGDPSTPWDDIAAVQHDSDRGQGHVEYREIVTDQATRHNMRPPDWNINQSQFDELFGWVLPLHAARKAEMEAERKAHEAAAEKARAEAEAAALAQQQADADQINRGEASPAPAIDTSQLKAAVAEKDAEIAALNAKLAAVEAKVDAIVQGVDDAAKGDGA
jgi:hypothetical protein